MKKILLIMLLSTIMLDSIAQDGVNTQVIPPSPTAAALGKYGDIPVSLYTGVPNISIPIYTVQGNGVSIPINMSYHASGIKVEDIASWVGLGWSLSAGGIINRQISGLADEHPLYGYNLYGEDYLNLPSPLDFTVGSGYTEVKNLLTGVRDAEPDLYRFSFPGGQGKFATDFNGNTKVIPHNLYKVDLSGFPNEINITDDKGIRYAFRDYEKTDTGSPCGGNSLLPAYWYNSSWYLSEVTSLVTNDAIIFSYDTVSITTSHINRETKIYDVMQGNQIGGTDCNIPKPYTIRRLKSIVSKYERVVFIPSTTDKNLVDEQALDSIIIYNEKNEEIKSYVFNYSYYDYNGDPNGKRLKLDNITESTPESSKPPYSFDYNSTNLPPINSMAQDEWGYFNGKFSNSTLIPKTITWHKQKLLGSWASAGSYTARPKLHSFDGADRQVDSLSSQAGVLNKITYPTGGTTEFEYENNDVAPEEQSTYLDDEDRFFRVKYDYRKRFFGDTIMKDSSMYLIAVSGDINSPTQYDERTIYINSDQYISVKGEINGMLGEPVDSPQPGRIKKFGIAGIDVSYNYEVNQNSFGETNPNTTFNVEHSIFLTKGTYKFYVQSDVTQESNKMVTLRVNWLYNTGLGLDKKLVGGLRIKRIITKDEVSSPAQIKRYEYRLESNPNKSSGLTIKENVLSHVTYGIGAAPAIDLISTTSPEDVEYREVNFGTDEHPDIVNFIALPNGNGENPFNNSSNLVVNKNSSNNNPDLVVVSHPESGKDSGTPFYYTHVTVYDGENGEYGKTEHTFLSPESQQGLNTNAILDSPYTYDEEDCNFYPFPYETSYQWKAGLLTNQKTFSKEADESYRLIQENINDYLDTTFIHGDQISAVKFAFHGAQGVLSNNDIYKKIHYYLLNGYTRQKQTTTKYYDEVNSLEHINTSNFYYDHSSHYQLTKKVQDIGNNEKAVTKYYYPLDSLHLPDAQDFIYNNIIAQPVETVSWKETGTVKNIIAGSKTYFNGDIYADSVHSTEISSPVNFTDESNLLNTITGYYQNKINVSGYDGFGNIMSYQKSNNIHKSYIWGYDDRFVICEITNAQTAQFFYTSFETISSYVGYKHQGNGSFIDSNTAKTGDSYFDINNEEDFKKIIDYSGDMFLSFWSRGTANVSINNSGVVSALITSSTPDHNGWSFNKYKLTMVSGVTQLIISGDTDLDEVRLHPTVSVMKTFTFHPSFGITSITDENNTSIFYEYDSFGRLKYTRDHEKNILNTYEYHYK